jgi:hypothetical protein
MGSAAGALGSLCVLPMLASVVAVGVSLMSVVEVMPGWLAGTAGWDGECRDKSIRCRTCALRERWDARAVWLKAS